MKRFNWNSRKEVEAYMKYLRSKFSRIFDVRPLSQEEIDLWISLDYYFATHKDFYRIKQMVYNYCNPL